ncbi:MAG: nucleotidyltransferase family protein [Anaerolineae bacterium]|nr:nucleotidyltransferase family protein [Anaerolineae bacterium]MDW8070901.1 nucleotidyltransferase family protein [Anaerolineae bacterium]
MLSGAVWQHVARCAIQSGTAALLYGRLVQTGLIDALPSPEAQLLRRAYLETAASNVRLGYWLRRVLEALAAADIPVVLLKGAHLAWFVYPHPGWRPMGDVDVLVQPVDLARLGDSLAPLGIHPLPDHYQQVEQPMRHVSYATPRGVLFEFHTALLNPDWPVCFDYAALWAATREVAYAGMPVRVLAPEHLLLHLCAHLFSHRALGSLLGLCDIAETVRHYRTTLDWPAVVRQSTEWGLERCVGLALQVAHTLLAVPVPLEVLWRLRPEDAPVDAVTTVITGLATPDDIWRFEPVTQLWSGRTSSQRLRTLMRAAFAPRRELAYTYRVPAGSPRILLYYPLRWVTRLGKVLPLLWAMLRRDPRMAQRVAQQNRWSQLRAYLFRLV